MSDLLKKAIPLLLLLVIFAPLAGDFDHGAYRESTLANATAHLGIDPRADYWFDASHPKYRVNANVTGRTRPIDPAIEDFIAQWVKAMGHPVEYARMFRLEVEIEQSGKTFWMPIQDSLTGPWSEDMSGRDRADLYLLLMGAYKHAPVFAISSFSAIRSDGSTASRADAAKTRHAHPASRLPGGTMALDYDRLIHLDAEDLAEQGIGEAYRNLQSDLRAYIAAPENIEEWDDPELPAYGVVFRNARFVVYEPGLEDESWPRATYVFFKIINDQLADQAVRFYAINGGNDLGGMFLTPEEVDRARNALDNPRDWPYLPTLEPDWYGQPH